MTDAVRAAIAAKLSAIPNVGIVHAYQRYAAREKQLTDLYTTNGQLRGWFLRRVSIKEVTHSRNRNVLEVRWLIRGYLAIDDANASELVFDELLDLARAAFATEWLDNELDGAMYRAEEGKQAGLSVDDQSPVIFAGVLCHSAKCTLITRQFLKKP